MDQEQAAKIIANIADVQERIESTALKAGRNPAAISLIAVTKDKSAAIIKLLAENGIKKIGENYIQEAEFKIEILKDLEIEWHMMGNIQQKKEKKIAYLFDVIHSVNSKMTAQQLNASAEHLGKTLPIYLEINVSGEPTKQGWSARDNTALEELLLDVEELLTYPALRVQGLMTMAPYSTKPEDARPYFRRMREIRDTLNTKLAGYSAQGLSMGMSGDFQVAIEEGATDLRIGTALVGIR
jgi:pyridoxal phosphate enzyme (YggS family)